MDTNLLVGLLSCVVLLSTFLGGLWAKARSDRKLANREIYQRLELASIEVFRFEASNKEIIRHLWDGQAVLPSAPTERLIVGDYLCQILNLFEMAIRFREDEVFDHEIFATWVPWMFEVSTAPNFVVLWKDEHRHYTKTLRRIMEHGVKVKAEFADEKTRERNFYEGVGNIIGCAAVSNWRFVDIELDSRRAYED